MVMNFYPWEMDIDVEATRQLYEENDYAEDKAFNRRLADTMTQQQKDFFSSLGVDIHKMRAEEKIHDIPEEDGMSGGKIAVQKIDFFLCGKFLAIPDYQQELYGHEQIAELQLGRNAFASPHIFVNPDFSRVRQKFDFCIGEKFM